MSYPSIEIFPECPINTNLYCHQLDSISWCRDQELKGNGFVIGDIPGLGKTRQMSYLMELNQVLNTLIVCPSNLIDQWLLELLITSKRHFVYLISDIQNGKCKKVTLENLPHGVVPRTNNLIKSRTNYTFVEINGINSNPKAFVINYESVKPVNSYMVTGKKGGKKVTDYELDNPSYELIPFKEIMWDRIIGDEIHSIRNGMTHSSATGGGKKTAKFYNMMRLNMSSKGIRIGLSGTPIQNRLADLVSIFKWVGVDVSKNTSEQELIHHVEQRLFRRTDKNIHPSLKKFLKFPEPYVNNEIIVNYETENERIFYEAASESISGHNEKLIAIDKRYGGIVPPETTLELLNNLLYLTSSANMYIGSKNGDTTDYPLWSGTESKITTIVNTIIELGKKRQSGILFVKYEEEYDSFYRRFETMTGGNFAEFYIERISSKSVAIKDRSKIIERTRQIIESGRLCLLVITVKIGSEGLNLQHFSNILIATPDWNPAAEEQAIGRAQRIGQEKIVNVFRFFHQSLINLKSMAHIDIYIKNLQDKKRAIAEKFTEGTNAAFYWPKITLPGTNEPGVYFDKVSSWTDFQNSMSDTELAAENGFAPVSDEYEEENSVPSTPVDNNQQGTFFNNSSAITGQLVDNFNNFNISQPNQLTSNQFSQPSSTSTQPTLNFGHPSSTFSQPSSTFSQPSSTFSQPSSTFSQPSSTFSQPSSTFIQPTTSFGQPSSTFSQPTTTSTFSQPSSTFSQPTSTFTQPTSTFSQPSSTFSQPSSTFSQPTSTFSQPTSTFSQPTSTSTFGQPSSTFGQPSSTFGQSSSNQFNNF